MIFSSVNFNSQAIATTRQVDYEVETSIVVYTPSAPIQILNDGELAAIANSGSGTEVDPYIIEGLNITSNVQDAIYITGTTKYIVIRNNWIDGIDQSDYGINVNTISNVSILSNEIFGVTIGVWMSNLQYSLVAGNDIYDYSSMGIFQSGGIFNEISSNYIINPPKGILNHKGIYVTSSEDTLVDDNYIINDDGDYAIHLKIAWRANVSNNRIETNSVGNHIKYGIQVSSSPNVTIVGNEVFDGYYGINVQFGKNVIIEENGIQGSNIGMQISGSDGNQISNNRISDAVSYGLFLNEVDDNLILNNSITNSSTGIYLTGGTPDMINNTIEGNELIGSGIGVGIYLVNGVSNQTIFNNTIAKSSIGIRSNLFTASGLEPVIISQNSIMDHGSYGMDIGSARNVTITDNDIYDNGNIGIRLGDNADTVIANNWIFNNSKGIGIYGGSVNEKNNVTDNVIIDNGLIGIELQYFRFGNISGNWIEGHETGIDFFNSYNNSISDNVIYRHSLYALDIEVNSRFNNFTYNDFIANNIGGPQIWNNEVTTNVTHNFYAEWSGDAAVRDNNPTDGIIDFNYPFDGMGADLEPTLLPNNDIGFDPFRPFVNQPLDFIYEIGYTGNDVTWKVAGYEVTSYVVYFDGTEVASGLASDNVTINFDGEAVGLFNITIVFTNAAGQTGRDTVWLEVTPDNTAPSIQFRPADFTKEVGYVWSIFWEATDFSPGVYQIYENEVLINSDVWSSGERIFYNLTDLAVGVFNYTIVFYDLTGNSYSDEAIVTVLADVDNPIITLSDDSYQYNAGDTGNIYSWHVSDTNLFRYEIFVDNVIVETDGLSPTDVSITFNLDGLPGGVYNITLFAYDLYDNSGSAYLLLTVYADEIAPQIGYTAYWSMNEFEDWQTLEWTITDENPGNYWITMDGVLVDEGTWRDGFSISYSVGHLSDGSYTFIMEASDLSDNRYSVTTILTVHDVPDATNTDDPPTTSDPPDTNTFNEEPDDSAGGFLPISSMVFITSLIMVAVTIRITRSLKFSNSK